MKLSIGQNIRSYRKARGFTQEQLAEAVGVTIGAVSKWESDLSRPDIELLVELADFFEISVDVLLGYEWKNRNLGQTIEHLKTLYREKQYEEAAREVDKALQKYPNSFEIIYNSASLLYSMGIERKNTEALQKSLDLYRHSLNFLQQNTDETISEPMLNNRIGEILVLLGRIEEAIALLKKYNYDGMNSGKIGLTLSFEEKTDEALSYLSESMLEAVSELFRDVTGYINCFMQMQDTDSALGILEWARTIVQGLMIPGKVNYAYKIDTLLLTLLALVKSAREDPAGTQEALKMAREKAVLFDANPDYNATAIRFYYGKEESLCDDFGETALQGVERILMENENNALLNIWRTLS